MISARISVVNCEGVARPVNRYARATIPSPSTQAGSMIIWIAGTTRPMLAVSRMAPMTIMIRICTIFHFCLRFMRTIIFFQIFFMPESSPPNKSVH